MGNELARVDQTEWTDEQIRVIKDLVLKEGSDAELAAFMHVVRRTGLDPIARQIGAQFRNDKRLGRKVMTIITNIDGYRVIALRSGQYAGQQGPWWCGPDGKWVDVWLSNSDPYAAKVGVLRHDFSEPLYAIARWDEYAQYYENKPSGLWGKMGPLMIAKCAESLALRKAFPNDLSGVYTKEEMDQADSEPSPPPPKVRAVKEAPALEAAPASEPKGTAPDKPAVSGKAAFFLAVKKWSGMTGKDHADACHAVARKLGHESAAGLTDEQYAECAAFCDEAREAGTDFIAATAPKTGANVNVRPGPMKGGASTVDINVT
jgi:phage recombination protein Bet